MRVCVCSHVVWIGDLNYRIEGLDAVVRKKIREGDLAYLFERDQVPPSRELTHDTTT